MVSRAIDLTGQRFGRLIVLKRDANHISPKGVKSAKWICKCDCGNTASVWANGLRKGTAKSCGCYQKDAVRESQFKDLTGLKFGRLSVIEFDHKNKRNESYWKCECDCGNISVTRSNGLISGRTQSCGCIQRETASKFGGWNFKDLTGKTFGNLTVCDLNSKEKNKVFWNCNCSCGEKTIVSTSDLQTGNTKSCGCQNESFIASKVKEYFSYHYEAEKEKKIFKNIETNQWLKCDIYIPYGENPEVNGFYIEVHGEQHYRMNGLHKLMSRRKKTTPEEEFEYQKHKDKMKKKYCRKTAITLK